MDVEDTYTDTDIGIDEDRFVDMPEADFAFLREAVSKLSGKWIVTERREALTDGGGIVTFADIEPAPSNTDADTAFDVQKTDRGTYAVWAFVYPWPDREEDEQLEFLLNHESLEAAFRTVAGFILDPCVMPNAETKALFTGNSKRGDGRETTGFDAMGNMPDDVGTSVFGFDELVAAARRFPDGWQGTVPRKWERSAASGRAGVTSSPLMPSVWEAIIAACDIERAKRRQVASLAA